MKEKYRKESQKEEMESQCLVGIRMREQTEDEGSIYEDLGFG